MKIAVLGTGVVGQALGTRLVHLGHEVMLGSRDAANPKAIAWSKEEGTRRALYGTFANAAAFGEIIFNCTLGSASLEALTQAGAENLNGKILIDTSNPIDHTTDPMSLTVCNTDSLGEQIQRAFPDVKVVKTLNTMNVAVMLDPSKLSERSDVFVSGNDVQAKMDVIRILREWFGWKTVIDLGDITTSRGVEMFIPFWVSIHRVFPNKRFNIKIVTS